MCFVSRYFISIYYLQKTSFVNLLIKSCWQEYWRREEEKERERNKNVLKYFKYRFDRFIPHQTNERLKSARAFIFLRLREKADFPPKPRKKKQRIKEKKMKWNNFFVCLFNFSVSNFFNYRKIEIIFELFDVTLSSRRTKKNKKNKKKKSSIVYIKFIKILLKKLYFLRSRFIPFLFAFYMFSIFLFETKEKTKRNIFFSILLVFPSRFKH